MKLKPRGNCDHWGYYRGTYYQVVRRVKDHFHIISDTGDEISFYLGTISQEYDLYTDYLELINPGDIK